jgi:hypothetical protein
MRRLVRLALWLVLALGVVVVALTLLLRAGPLARHLRRLVRQQLSRQLGREVTIEEASFSPIGGVHLREVAVRNRDGSSLLRCPELEVRIGLAQGWKGLFSRPTDLKIQQLILARPELALARDGEGRWNIEDLLRAKRTGPGFQGEVTIRQGKITLTDGVRGGLVSELSGVDFESRAREPGVWRFSARVARNEGVLDELELTGDAHQQEGRMLLKGSAKGVELPYLFARMPETGAIGVEGGRAEAKGRLSLRVGPGARSQISYDVEAAVEEGKATFPWLRRPVEGVSGRLLLKDGDLRLEEVSGHVARAPVQVEGAISDLASPTLALDIRVSGVRYSQLRALFPRVALPAGLFLPSPMRIAARAEGPASAVKVTGKAAVRVIKFRFIPWNDVVARFEYSGGELKVTGLRAQRKR